MDRKAANKIELSIDDLIQSCQSISKTCSYSSAVRGRDPEIAERIQTMQSYIQLLESMKRNEPVDKDLWKKVVEFSRTGRDLLGNSEFQYPEVTSYSNFVEVKNDEIKTATVTT